jgi:16S rRNA processing protein RimM
MAGPRRVVLGVVTGAHGVRGQVRLRSFTGEPAGIAAYGPLDGSNGQRLEITRLTPHKSGFVASIAGIETRDQAEALKGVELSIDRARLPATGEDEVYHADLIGLEVVGTGGRRLGTVAAVQDFGAGTLLELKLDGHKATCLVPFNRQCVPELDLEAGRVTIDPPEGLLPE